MTIDERIEAIATAVAATHDAAVILAGRLAVATLVGQLQALQPSIAAYDRQIAEFNLAAGPVADGFVPNLLKERLKLTLFQGLDQFGIFGADTQLINRNR